MHDPHAAKTQAALLEAIVALAVCAVAQLCLSAEWALRRRRGQR